MERVQQPLRLPRDMKERLERAARRKGVSIQTYMQMAIEARLETDEETRRQRQDDRRQQRRDQDAPQGLGLRRLSPQLSTVDSWGDVPAEKPTGPVVVNVGTREGAAEGGLIAGLVDFVTTGPAFSREQRKRTAVDVIRAHGKTSEEREGLARQLDAALADRKPQSGLARLASSAIGEWFR